MRNALVRIVAALAWIAAAASSHAQSSPGPDPTGLWFDPAQPGWGLEVVQQGTTGFAVVFTYDANHKPVWYVAPNLALLPDMSLLQLTMTGALYRTAIPGFSAGSFDPRAVGVTGVGSLQLQYSVSG